MTVLYLASTSPARLAVLRAAGIEPRVVPSHVDEDAVAARAGRPLAPEELVQLLARAKAEAVAHPELDGLILGGDSAFEFDGEIWGKPHDPGLATERIRRMRGHSGVLYSGHWLIDNRAAGDAVGAVDSARVAFADFSDAAIDAYVATGEPLEVAGSFTIDGRGAAFIERIEGAPSCVIGLSVPTVRVLAEQLGVDWPSLWNISR